MQRSKQKVNRSSRGVGLPSVHEGKDGEASGGFHLDAANEGVFSIITSTGCLEV